MELLIGFVAGVFVGWHFPAPAWAQPWVTKIVDKVKGLFKKKE